MGGWRIRAEVAPLHSLNHRCIGRCTRSLQPAPMLYIPPHRRQPTGANPPRCLLLVVETFLSRTLICVHANPTLDDLRIAIENEYGIPPHRQYLVWNRHVLDQSVRLNFEDLDEVYLSDMPDVDNCWNRPRAGWQLVDDHSCHSSGS